MENNCFKMLLLQGDPGRKLTEICYKTHAESRNLIAGKHNTLNRVEP